MFLEVEYALSSVSRFGCVIFFKKKVWAVSPDGGGGGGGGGDG